MQYRKVVFGWCEVIYDMETGEAKQVLFVANDGEQIERRMVREEGEEVAEGELEDYEIIEHAEDVAELESREKDCPLEMVQPVPLGQKRIPVKKQKIKGH